MKFNLYLERNERNHLFNLLKLMDEQTPVFLR